MKSEKRRRRSFRNKSAVSFGLSAFAFVVWSGIEFLTNGAQRNSILPLLIAAALLAIGCYLALGRRRIRIIK
jgi:hypothetical protein